MTNTEIVCTMDQDELLKAVLDGDTITYTRTNSAPGAHGGDRERLRININEVDGLMRDQEILSRIKRQAKEDEPDER
jgi:hypothetical protein